MKDGKSRRRIVLATAGLTLLVGGSFLWARVLVDSAQTHCAKWKSDVMAIGWACKEFAHDHDGRYPTSLNELMMPTDHLANYLEGARLPLDPWQRPYGYEPPTDARLEPRIFTLGRDGIVGGDGDDADLDNFMLFENEESEPAPNARDRSKKRSPRVDRKAAPEPASTH